MIEFSILRPVKSGGPLVRECVEYIRAQVYPHSEPVVPDNQSNDETVGWLKARNDPWVRIGISAVLHPTVDCWARIKPVEKQEFIRPICRVIPGLFDARNWRIRAGRHVELARW